MEVLVRDLAAELTAQVSGRKTGLVDNVQRLQQCWPMVLQGDNQVMWDKLPQ